MCHVPNGLMGDPPEGYRLDTYEETISTVDRARVVPGNALASELYLRIVGHAQPRMPLNGPPYLDENEIQRISQWTDEGARDSSGNPVPNINGARVRMHGRLSNRSELDGLMLKLHADTRFKKSRGSGIMFVCEAGYRKKVR